jgi:hypothetical protein
MRKKAQAGCTVLRSGDGRRPHAAFRSRAALELIALQAGGMRPYRSCGRSPLAERDMQAQAPRLAPGVPSADSSSTRSPLLRRAAQAQMRV